MRIKYQIISIVIFLSVAIGNAQQPDISKNENHFKFEPSLRSVQVDGTFAFFALDFGGSVDVDFIQFAGGKNSTFGIRAGMENWTGGSPGGSGESYLDYNFLLRSTLPRKYFRIDLLVGYTYHIKNSLLFGGGLKAGCEIRWKIAPGIFGMLTKMNWSILSSHGYAGIGFYIGYDQ